jgi:hypothetical protein
MVDFKSVEVIANALDFNIEKQASNFIIKDSSGAIAFEAPKLGKAQAFLVRHVKKMAKALGFRLTSQKHTQSLYEQSSGEVRAKQISTIGYMLEREEIIVDEVRREDIEGHSEHNRRQRDQRAMGSGRKREWLTVRGGDYSATLLEIIEYLKQHQADVGIDTDDIEIDDEKKPKVKPPTVQRMHGELKGHINAEKIKEIGVGNDEIDRRPKREDIRRKRSIEHIIGTLDGPGGRDIPLDEQQRLLRELGATPERRRQGEGQKGELGRRKRRPSAQKTDRRHPG